MTDASDAQPFSTDHSDRSPFLTQPPPQDLAEKIAWQLRTKLNLAWLFVLCKMCAAELLDRCDEAHEAGVQISDGTTDCDRGGAVDREGR
jgi:hypothetical protein